MKRKILLSVLITIILAANVTISAFAATEPKGMDALKNAKIPDLYLVQFENHLKFHKLTDEQLAAIEYDFDYVLKLIEKEQAADISQLSPESRNDVLTKLAEAAQKSGLIPVIDKNSAEEYLLALKDAGVPDNYLVELQNYINTNQLTDTQLAAVVTKLNYVVNLLMNEQITDISELSPEYKNEILGYLKEATNNIDLSAMADETALNVFFAQLKDSGLPDIYLIKLQNYLKTHGITQLQLTIVIIKYNYVADIMEKEKTKDVSKLSPEGKKEVIKTVKEAAEEADLTAIVDKNAAGRDVIELKDTRGNVVMEETADEQQLKKTGTTNYALLSGIAMIVSAGAYLVFIKRKVTA
ncbi:MAG: hypothetical protein ABRQ25_16680 [Clostridiaceae bacterium]